MTAKNKKLIAILLAIVVVMVAAPFLAAPTTRAA